MLAVTQNTGPLTYNGIELGEEQVMYEIETELKELLSNGYMIRKISIMAYILGRLGPWYTIGLLYSKRYFDKIKPINFTTFATPHVAVRSLARRNHFWNVLGARAILESGRQLFMINSFRDTGKPLLNILATPSSIFMLGLAKFKRRCGAAVYYTTAISKTDPFAQLGSVSIRYLPGYAPVLVDPNQCSGEDVKFNPKAHYFSVGGNQNQATLLPIRHRLRINILPLLGRGIHHPDDSEPETHPPT